VPCNLAPTPTAAIMLWLLLGGTSGSSIPLLTNPLSPSLHVSLFNRGREIFFISYDLK